MAVLDVTVQLETSLFLGNQKQGTLSDTLGFLPGAVLRGALGAFLARRCGHAPDRHQECDFAEVFQSAPVPRFGPCYPALTGFSFPFPTTARQCKYRTGFRAQDPDAHGISDILIPLFVFEEVSQHDNSIPVYDPCCPVCGSTLEPISTGFYESVGSGYRQPRMHVRRISRTAINRMRGVAYDELLYTRGYSVNLTEFRGINKIRLVRGVLVTLRVLGYTK
jgi:hypothetical protein